MRMLTPENSLMSNDSWDTGMAGDADNVIFCDT